MESMGIEDCSRACHGWHTGRRFQFNGVEIVDLALSQELAQSAMIVRMPGGDPLDRHTSVVRMAGDRLALAGPGEILRSQSCGVVLDRTILGDGIVGSIIVVVPSMATPMMATACVRMGMLEARQMVQSMPQQPGRPVEDDQQAGRELMQGTWH